MKSDNHRNCDPVVGAGQKQKYQSPMLLVFGKVAALTLSASCVAKNDSSTTCDPTQMNAAMVSDRRVKECIVRVGTHPLGIGLYLFNYKAQFRDTWGHGRQFGVMADEVESVVPEAVCEHPDGYKMVNYSMLGITQCLS